MPGILPAEPPANNPTAPPFLTRLIATGLFSGYSPVIPGTAGSLVGLALYTVAGTMNWLAFSAVTIAVLWVGVVTSRTMEKHYGDDPQIVVIDEIVGMWISLLLLPKTLAIAAAGFILFRIYDTVKPPPARQLERLHHGWGVMLDDVAAGVYANATLRIALLVFPSMK